MDPDLLTDDVSWASWEKITGAKGTGVNAHYTPGYDTRVGGKKLLVGDTDFTPDTATTKTEQWQGGDIDVNITVTAATETAREFTTYAWSNPKCLRVAFMYDDGVDRTHAEPDDLDTAVDETMEGAYKGSEFPVKRPDDRNDAPVFTIDGEIDDTDGGKVVSRYTAERKENVEPFDADDNNEDGATRRINEAFPATDPMTNPESTDGVGNRGVLKA